MRLFLFLVGGTGSRVMRPLIMQMAAGVHPVDAQGQPIFVQLTVCEGASPDFTPWTKRADEVM